MRNILKTFLLFSIVVLIFGLLPAKANAATVTESNIPGLYIRHVVTSYDSIDPKPWIIADGQIVYCIEPGMPVKRSDYYSTTDWSVTGFSNELKEELQLIGYYGYHYPGHQTAKYYAAAQELIWRAILPTSSHIIEWYSNASGTPLSVEAEKNEINRLIAEHKKNPSFASKTFKLRVGKELEVTDTNNVLANFKISGQGVANYTISANKLKITALEKAGTDNLTLTRNLTNLGSTIIYYQDSTQNAAFLTLSSAPTTNFNVVVYDKYKPETPVKSVNTEKIELGKDFDYQISHHVDLDDSGIYLEKYIFTDILEDCLEVSKVTVTNENDEDVTDLFEYQLEENEITLTAKDLDDKDFYGHTYKFNITVHTKKGYDMSAYQEGDTYIIPNTAEITTDDTTVPTNEVEVNYTPEKVNVPKTAAEMSLRIVLIGLGLVAVAIAGYYIVYFKKAKQK